MTSLPANVRIVAYNFLSGGSRRRSGHWARLARSLGPQLVLAQECRAPVDAPDERFRPTPSDSLLWEPVAGRTWGSGLLSRASLVTAVSVPDFGGWVVGGEVPSSGLTNGRRLRAFSIHVPVGAHGYVRTVHEILDRIAPLSEGADLVLGGDFNVAVGYRLASEKRRISRGERALLDRLVNDFGLASCWQAAHPNRPLAQTLRWTADRLTPYHCDGIFVPASWLPRLVSCRVVRGPRWDALSDHSPVVAEFERYRTVDA